MTVSAAAPSVSLASEQTTSPVSSRSRSRFGFAGLGLIAAVAGGYLWLHRGLESTDDAQVDGDVVQVPSRVSGVVSAGPLQGQPARERGGAAGGARPAPARAKLAQAEAELLAARASADAEDASARLTEQSASAGRDVAKASLSGASIAVRATSAQIAEARASTVAARSNRDQAQHDLGRTQELSSKGAVPQAELDSAQTRFASARSVAGPGGGPRRVARGDHFPGSCQGQRSVGSPRAGGHGGRSGRRSAGAGGLGARACGDRGGPA